MIGLSRKEEDVREAAHSLLGLATTVLTQV